MDRNSQVWHTKHSKHDDQKQTYHVIELSIDSRILQHKPYKKIKLQENDQHEQIYIIFYGY